LRQPFQPPLTYSSPELRPIIDGPGSIDTVDETAIAYSDEPSKRAVVIAAALALATNVVVTTQVRPALLRRAVRLAIPVVLTRPVAGILTRLGV
jgi:small neutral amino acid transporter SnatA (MarC family)